MTKKDETQEKAGKGKLPSNYRRRRKGMYIH